jgi:hypothetical protein
MNLIEKIREELSEALIVGCSCCGYDFTGGFIHTYVQLGGRKTPFKPTMAFHFSSR